MSENAVTGSPHWDQSATGSPRCAPMRRDRMGGARCRSVVGNEAAGRSRRGAEEADGSDSRGMAWVVVLGIGTGAY